MLRHPQVGDVAVFHDSEGKAHNALITCYFGCYGEDGELLDQIGCANLVIVSADERRKDECGRQIERFTSIQHASQTNVHGNYWRWSDEKPNEYRAPTSV